MKTKITVDPTGEFKGYLRILKDGVSDLRIPLELIRESWFKTNRAIFALKGPGRYADLTTAYKIEKQRAVGFVYPILERQGILKNAMLVPGDPNSISRLIGTKAMDLGVTDSIPYFGYLQNGTKRMAARPYVLLGAEQVAPDGMNQRVIAWRKILTDYVMAVTGAK